MARSTPPVIINTEVQKPKDDKAEQERKYIENEDDIALN